MDETHCMPRAKERSSSSTERSTIISSGIWVMATTNVMKKSRTRKAMMASHIGDGQGPAVATGTAVTSEAEAATAATPVQFG